MADGGLTVRAIDGIAAVDAGQWDGCAGIGSPFNRHAFLAALESSGSACPESGWAAHHLLVEDASGHLQACAPLYVKSHSYGEYVFDWSWADAWARAGRQYYPKLQCAVPFTPATGRRLLVRPQPDGGTAALEGMLASAMRELTRRAALSSAHVTFATQAEAESLAAEGWLLRIGEQFHWTNRNYGSFDDFLGALSSRKRKSIRKERERANGLGLRIHTLTGNAVTPAHWDAFYSFYLNTAERKWSHAYLTREFFLRLGETMSTAVVLIMAEQDGQWVAGALNLLGEDTLFGRNWGALGEFRWLHFELCYYRAIDFAIEHRLTRVEAGAQGEHKVSRGYDATPTWSAHWIREAPFRDAVAAFLEAERRALARQIEEHAEHSAYRKSIEASVD
ncbi:MAG TPA: N-acetyltransferase [Rhodospirillaceae bacterium]|nr:N-acetyltransferase [Rhodospirillaceae bacterium]